MPVVLHLHNYLAAEPSEFYREVSPVIKRGIRFLWGPRPWFDYSFLFQFDVLYAGLPKIAGYYVVDGDNQDIGQGTALMSRDKAFTRGSNGAPVVSLSFAYHLENRSFVAWLEKQARRTGVSVIDANVTGVSQDERGVSGVHLSDGRTLAADLYVDCSGFRSLLLGKTLGEPFIPFTSSLYCDRALVGEWPRIDEPIQPYTLAETMDCGWCWRIDHDSVISRGYVYSSSFLSDADAEKEFRVKNPKLGNLRIIHYRTGRFARAWVKNVLAVGNANGFVEPLESTGVGSLCFALQTALALLVDCGCEPAPSIRGLFNLRNGRNWDSIRAFLALHYKFNTRLDNAFWRECREKADLAGAEPVVEYFQENGPSALFKIGLIDNYDVFRAEGYLAMLIGMKLPCRHSYVASAGERETWSKIRALHARKATEGLSNREAMTMLKNPQFAWDPEFYKPRGQPSHR
jgi:tryptophan halogenase